MQWVLQSKPREGVLVEAAPRWVWAVGAGAAATYAGGVLWLHSVYRLAAFDVGIYEQTNWLIAHGQSFNTVGGFHIFGAHFSPALVVLAPVNFLPGGPLPELIFQSLWIAGGVLPAYRMGRALGHPAVYVVGYAFHAGVVTGVYTGWRGWSLALPGLMALVSAVVTKADVKWVWAGAAMLVLFREDMALWVLLVLAIGVQGRWMAWRLAIAVGGMAIAYGAIVTAFVMPAFSPTDEYLFDAALAPSANLLSGSAVELTIFRVFYLMAPLGLLPVLRGWRFMWPLALPLAGLIMRGHGEALTTKFHYEMLFVPLLLMVMAAAGTRHTNLRVAVLSALIALVAVGPFRPYVYMGKPTIATTPPFAAEFRQIDAWLDGQDSDVGLALPTNLVSRHAERPQITIFSVPV